jgi:hypothetical protein
LADWRNSACNIVILVENSLHDSCTGVPKEEYWSESGTPSFTRILPCCQNTVSTSDNGAILYDSHQYDRAIEQFRYVLEMEPNFPRAGVIVEAYVQKRMFTEAIA